MNPTDRINLIPPLPNMGGQANVPGLRRLWLIEARHVLGLVDPRTVAGAITSTWLLTPDGLQLSEDAVVQELKFPANRGDYEQKPLTTVQGIAYGQSIVLAVPRDNMTTALLVQRMTGRRWVAIYEDGNGQRKLIGTPKQPLSFLAQTKTSPNGYLFSWTTETKQPAYFFNDSDIFLTEADFSFGFSYDFYS